MRVATTSALAGVVLLAAAASAGAQESQESLKQKLDEKLAEPWVASGGWVTDYEKALERAGKDGKVIAAYFTRSYAP